MSRMLVSRCWWRVAELSRHHGCVVGMRPLSTVTSSTPLSENNTNGEKKDSFDTNKYRGLVLESALKQVPQYGWTEDAIAAGVVHAKLPLTMVGMVSPASLVEHVMEQGNLHLLQELQDTLLEQWKTQQQANLPSRLVTCLKLRLEYIIPHIQSQQWHEAMALGAMPPYNMTVTAKQLNDMVTMVSDAIIVGTNHAPFGPLERTAIAAVYAATELFLLTDTSENYQDTWNFLQDRVREMEILATTNWNPTNFVNGDAAVAASAVAMSLGGAVLSLAQPAAKGAVSTVTNTLAPQLASAVMQSIQPQQSSATMAAAGTRPSDYEAARAATPDLNDLPPLPNEKNK